MIGNGNVRTAPEFLVFTWIRTIYRRLNDLFLVAWSVRIRVAMDQADELSSVLGFLATNHEFNDISRMGAELIRVANNVHVGDLLLLRMASYHPFGVASMEIS